MKSNHDRRPEHQPDGDPCYKCGVRASRHRPGRNRQRNKPKPRRNIPQEFLGNPPFVGIDGEGKTIGDSHCYTLLAAVNEYGETMGYIENPEGLSTDDCLAFLTDLAGQKLFAYSFNYDMTKLLEGFGNRDLYLLNHQELRQGKHGPIPILYPDPSQPRYSINLFNTRLTIKPFKGEVEGKKVWGEQTVVNDIWKFFQGRFVKALEDWKVGNPELWARMQRMKELRSEFDKVADNDKRAYCFEECQCMAQLARLLYNAHIKAGLKLKSWFGAGSTSSAVLTKIGIGKHIKLHRQYNPIPDEMKQPIAQAFFGGRFENSMIGLAPAPIYSYDISSAYPYQMTFLPCLVHGRWEKLSYDSKVRIGERDLVHYRLHGDRRIPWGPLPFRLPDGSICYPRSSGGGWVWGAEFLAAQTLCTGVEARELWKYHRECICQPFRELPGFYRERCRIGKEGPGIVIKLGINGCYGKTAQSVGGEGPFTSWVWAGMITSGTRAQMLEVMALHDDLHNLLYIATDGIATRERLDMPRPKDTGTYDLAKPLGGWEESILERDLFLARPGIYFCTNPTAKDLAKVRARGVGRGIILEQHAAIYEGWKNGQTVVHLKDLQRFLGMKSSINRSGKAPFYEYRRSEKYGTWIKRPVVMSFDPLPKRVLLKDGSLGLRHFPQEVESKPYDPSLLSKEALELKLLTQEANEQPYGEIVYEEDYE
jgi:hypothetical protein